MSYLSSNLKFLRQKKGLTQQDFADQIPKTRECYQRWESGSNEPDNFSLQEMAKLHNVTVDQLLNTDLSKAQVIISTIKCCIENQGI